MWYIHLEFMMGGGDDPVYILDNDSTDVAPSGGILGMGVRSRRVYVSGRRHGYTARKKYFSPSSIGARMQNAFYVVGDRTSAAGDTGDVLGGHAGQDWRRVESYAGWRLRPNTQRKRSPNRMPRGIRECIAQVCRLAACHAGPRVGGFGSRQRTRSRQKTRCGTQVPGTRRHTEGTQKLIG